MVSILWGDAQDKQLSVLETIYKKTVAQCSLGDWDLGFKQHVLQEDGLAALIEMCSCCGHRLPALPLHVLNAAISDSETGRLHFTRLGHVLNKFACRCNSAAFLPSAAA
jgi:hypothetical protein